MTPARNARARALYAGGVELRPVARRWRCPSCGDETQTTDPRPHTPFHPCRALRGLTAPYVDAALRAEHRAIERDDYVGQERVQTDGEGRPVAMLRTVRDDGEDCTVYAPTAVATAES